jgi:hypothetical protein
MAGAPTARAHRVLPGPRPGPGGPSDCVGHPILRVQRGPQTRVVGEQHVPGSPRSLLVGKGVPAGPITLASESANVPGSAPRGASEVLDAACRPVRNRRASLDIPMGGLALVRETEVVAPAFDSRGPSYRSAITGRLHRIEDGVQLIPDRLLLRGRSNACRGRSPPSAMMCPPAAPQPRRRSRGRAQKRDSIDVGRRLEGPRRAFRTSASGFASWTRLTGCKKGSWRW